MIVSIAILVFFGVLLMVLETFVPGWIAGIIGVVCILSGVVMVMTADEFAAWAPWQRTAAAVGILLVSAGVLLVWMKLFGIKIWRRSFTLVATIQTPLAPERGMPAGTEGVALSELRPLGRADFSGQRREVRCEDGFAPAGARVRVTGTEPGNLLVRILQAPSSLPGTSPGSDTDNTDTATAATPAAALTAPSPSLSTSTSTSAPTPIP